SLVDYISRQQLAGQAARLRDDLLTLQPPPPLEAACWAEEDRNNSPNSLTPQKPPPGAMTWNIPLQLTVQLGSPAVANQAYDRGQPRQPAPSATATNGNGNNVAVSTRK